MCLIELQHAHFDSVNYILINALVFAVVKKFPLQPFLHNGDDRTDGGKRNRRTVSCVC